KRYLPYQETSWTRNSSNLYIGKHTYNLCYPSPVGSNRIKIFRDRRVEFYNSGESGQLPEIVAHPEDSDTDTEPELEGQLQSSDCDGQQQPNTPNTNQTAVNQQPTSARDLDLTRGALTTTIDETT